jgi:hypothetical protein
MFGIQATVNCPPAAALTPAAGDGAQCHLWLEQLRFVDGAR